MFGNFQFSSLAVIPVLGFLIFVHELGHFLAARWMGIRVLEFGFGYPPRMFKMFDRNGVEYTFNWLPLGGFVRMAGEEGDFGAEGSMATAAPWRRIIVLAAGPFMNLLTAVVVFAIVLTAGVPTNPVRLAAVSPGGPAALAGLQAGDVISSVDGKELLGIQAISQAIRSSAGQEVTVSIKRGEETITVTFVPRLPAQVPEGQGAAGIQIEEFESPEGPQIVRANPISAFIGGINRTVELIVLIVGGLATLIQGLISPKVDLPEGGVGGVVAIGRIAAQVAQQGWRQLLTLTAFLSVNLAILNLLPIPALDGGRILFALVEAVRRKRIPPEKEALVHLAGFAVLIAFMLIITFVDVSNWLAGRPALPGG